MNARITKKRPRSTPRPPEQLAVLEGGAGVYLLGLEGIYRLWVVEGEGPTLQAAGLRLPDGRALRPERRRASWVFELGAVWPASIWLTYEVNGLTRGESIEL